jgi:acetyl-CoA C-acetyltransferase
MASHGIKDRVAIVGMGCTPFKEHWDKGLDDLALEASNEAFAGAGITSDDVDAYWFGTAQSAMSGIPLARALQLQGKPVTRVENFCATGSEALRQAAYAVASGAYDVAMAVGVEKVKDSGYQGLNAFPIPNDGTTRTLTAAGSFSMVAPGLRREVRRAHGAAQAHARSHRLQEPLQRRPQPPRPVPPGDERRADLRHAERGRRPQRVRLRRGGRRCGGGHRGAGRGRPPLHRHADLREGAELRGRQRLGPGRPELRLHLVPRDRGLRHRRLRPGRHHRPGGRIAMAEVHDCFTPTELVLMEDLQFSERGHGWEDIEAGRFDLGGELPVNPDGGLKSFGHPVGASGLRMMFEAWLQLRGEAPEDRRISSIEGDRNLALTHNLGGYPGEMVSFISILGPELD